MRVIMQHSKIDTYKGVRIVIRNTIREVRRSKVLQMVIVMY